MGNTLRITRDGMCRMPPWKVAVIYGLLQKNKIQPAEVIEVGCGAGTNLVELAKADQDIKKLSGYDISPQAIDLAVKKFI